MLGTPVMTGSANKAAIVPLLDPSAHQAVALSITSAISGALIAGETYRVWSSVACFIKFGGSAVTASTTDIPLSSQFSEYFTIFPGENFIAGIVSSGTGTLFITKVR